ncbi:MAG: hypothetical protein HUU49_04280 [Candidatus Buchananbacteria bacterium]|nr:hypothetical protein [Candidatus Buchananbacteria bacterium]
MVIRCMDRRIGSRKFADLLDRFEICQEGEYDLVSVAGAAKDILSDQEGEQEYLFKQIARSVKLHGTTRIFLFFHQECGAYGITDHSLEEMKQEQDIAEIIGKIKSRFPDLTVYGYIMTGLNDPELDLKPTTPLNIGKKSLI